MAVPLISAVTNLALAPARLAGRLLSAALNQGVGDLQPDAAVPRPAGSPRPRAAAARRAASQQRTRRSKARPAERRISPGPVTAEAPAPSVAEPSPKEVSARRAGRAPAPLGSTEGSSEEPTPAEGNGPDAAHRGSRLKPETVKAEMHRRTGGPGSPER